MNRKTELISDPVNLEKVKENLQKYTGMLEEFNDLHKCYQVLLLKDECVADTEQWYEPKMINIVSMSSRLWLMSGFNPVLFNLHQKDRMKLSLKTVSL